MLRVDPERWNQTQAELCRQALTATHDRSRERFPALHEVTQGACAAEVAARAGRHAQSVMDWVHTYNEHGPEALACRRTGGRPPFAPAPRQRLASKPAPRSRRPSAHL